MKIRKYSDSDCEIISTLFYETIHAVNVKDYTQIQLAAWADSPERLIKRRNDLARQLTLIVELDGDIIGFGSIDKTGYLDLLFVHKNFQRRGVATALCDELEKSFSVITTYASVTAKPFFERRGYIAIKERETERSGVKLKNYEMKKYK